LILKSRLIDGASMQFNDNTEVAYFLLGHPVYQSFNEKLFIIMMI